MSKLVPAVVPRRDDRYTTYRGVYVITTYVNQNREPVLRSPLPTLRLISV